MTDPIPTRPPVDFKSLLFVDDPFETIELDGVEPDLQGWGANHGFFRQIIKAYRPATIVELGTWKGASAIHMADLCKEYGVAAQILCIDNWIGFPSYYLNKGKAHQEFKIKGGFPRLYWTFMKNVVDAGHQDMITPLVQQTYHAAQICRAKRIEPDLIYVDGDHSYEGCRSDLALFGPMVHSDGLILCDDYQWEGAQRAIDEFCAEHGYTRVIAGNKVLISKGRDISEIASFVEKVTANRKRMEDRKSAVENQS